MADISQIVQNALGGDQSAFEYLYSETRKAVYFTCIGFLKNEEDARDVMQEVYITAFEKLNTLGQAQKFGAWVKRIAVNKCKDFLIKKNAHPASSLGDDSGLEELSDENILPEEYVENAEKRETVMKIGQSVLSDTLYRTVMLFYFDEMSIAEIAEIMDCPEGTVKYRLNAARAKIKKGVLDYEKKNDDKLHSVAVIPFLTRLFDEAANSVEVPELHIGSMLPKKFSVSVNSAPGANVSAHTVSGGKVMLGSLKAKVIAGVCAAAVAGGGVTAGVLISKNAKKPSNPVTSQPALAASSGGAANSGSPNIVSSVHSSSAPGSPQSSAFSAPQSAVSVSSPEPVLTDWEYEEIEGGLRITKYNGKDEYVTVPAEIGGKQVLDIEQSDHAPEAFVFGESSNIKELTLPDGLTRIGNYAFTFLEKLETVHIPDSVTDIGYGAFSGCKSLDNVDIPEGENDFEFIFDNCKSLKNVTLPESTETLWSTFYSCTSLESVTIPAGVKNFEIVFEHCTGLKEVTFTGNNIEVIGHSSFIGCTSLENIVIPDGVKRISYNAFSGCTSLKSVTLPDGLAEIESGVFENCSALAELAVPDSVTKIAPQAFDGCTEIKVSYKGNVYDHEHLDELYSIFNGG